MQMQHKFGLCAHSVPLVSHLWGFFFCSFVFFLFKSASVANKSANILRRTSHLHSVSIVCFVDYLKRMCLKIVYLHWKQEANLYMQTKNVLVFFHLCFDFFPPQFGRGVTGIRCSSPSAVCHTLCDASFVLPHKDLKWLMLIYIYTHTHTRHIHTKVYIYIFCCFLAIN